MIIRNIRCGPSNDGLRDALLGKTDSGYTLHGFGGKANGTFVLHGLGAVNTLIHLIGAINTDEGYFIEGLITGGVPHRKTWPRFYALYNAQNRRGWMVVEADKSFCQGCGKSLEIYGRCGNCHTDDIKTMPTPHNLDFPLVGDYPLSEYPKVMEIMAAVYPKK